MRHNDPFDTPFFRDAEKRHKEFARIHGPGPVAKVGIALWGVFCLLLSLAGIALLFWAVITVVQWLVTK